MTNVSPMGQLRPVFADKNGKRLSGGKVFTYEPGTLTPKVTYTDALNLIPNTNPIDLNKYGEADIFLNGDYRIRVVDRHGVLIDDYDNLMAWATKRYLDLALSGLASGASKFYPTLAGANADIANIAVNQVVNIGELENGGLWFKESTESTTLTKTPYDTLELAKQYSNQKQVVQEQYINDLFAAQTQNVENLINQQGVALDQLDEYYNYLMQRLAQIAVDRGWMAEFVVNESGNSQQSINDLGGVDYWYEKIVGYPLHGEVRLLNGDIVQSTVAGNTANPNSDMTGWVNPKDKQDFINTSTKNSVIYADLYGLSESLDNTAKYDQIIADAPNGAKIVFPYAKKLKGHFISENKSFKIDLNGSTLINVLNNKPLLQLGSFTVTEYSVTESVLNHLDTTFTVVGASTYFKAGDIGYLWDGAKRNDGENVNHEMIKIKSISGDVITVTGFLASYKGASAIKFYHTTTQLKDASFSNGKFTPTSTHIAATSLIANVENPSVSNIETTGTTGHAVSIRFCYGAKITNIIPKDAASTSSGNGYGLTLNAVSKFVTENTNGSGMRHVYDLDSCYFGTVKNISDDNDQSAICSLAHNGFGGYIDCENVSGLTTQYPIVLSEQGYGGTVAALKRNHPFRNIKIRRVRATIRDTVTPDTNSCFGVYFQNNIVSCDVDDVRVDLKSTAALTTAAQSVIVRINGIATGGCTIKNLRANKIGKFIFASGTRDTFAFDNSQLVVHNLTADTCSYVYHLQGLFNINLDVLSVNGNILSGKIGYMQSTGVADKAYGATHGETFNYPQNGIIELDCNSDLALAGKLPLRNKNTGSSIALVADQSITLADIQDRSAWVRLNPPVGAGTTITLNATTALPKPQTIGDELYMSVPSGRNNVTFPAGSNINGGFTVNANDIVRLKVVANKWSLISRTSAS